MLHGVFQLTSSCYSREFFPGFFGFIDQCPVSASSRALFIDPIRVSFLGRASIICLLTINGLIRCNLLTVMYITKSY